MSNPTPELLIVMPAYNEEASIREVVAEWFAEAERVTGNFVMLVIDDGSRDGTHETLLQLQAEHGERLEVISRENRGHGQTCMQGYQMALERNIPLILQIDSDGQSDPQHFQEFWNRKNDHDVIYGKRTRLDGKRRVVASFILRWSLRLFAKVDCVDANVPYRLMNAQACARSIRQIPSGFLLANVALAVSLRRDPGISHGSINIGFPPRREGEASVPFAQFAAKAVQLFTQLKALDPPQDS